MGSPSSLGFASTSSLCPRSLSAYRILLLDAGPAHVRSLEHCLSQGGYFNYRGTTDSRCALSLYEEFRPDLILLDLFMPDLDGQALIRRIGPLISPEPCLPILALAPSASPQTTHDALSAGARDLLSKPFDPAEVLLRVRNLLELRHLHLQLAARNALLAESERNRAGELQEVQDEILDRLSLIAEYREDLAGGHAKRVGIVAERLARALGVPRQNAEIIRRAATLHDVGKVAIPDSILMRLGGLSPEEMAVMKTHTLIGARILSGARSAVLQMAESIALTHHERWDGTGYSPGLAGDSIPLEGRIVAVADAFDAMLHDRPYRRAMSVEASLEELSRESGRQFDPKVVAALVGEAQRSLLRLANATADKQDDNDPAARTGLFPAYTGPSK